MSKQRILQYYREIDEVIRYGGSYKESAIKTCFQSLLNDFCKPKGLRLIPEMPYLNKRIRPDGTIRDQAQQDWGYWESKDKYDDLKKEILNKFAAGYPQDNILFEDSNTAIIIRHGQEIMQCNIRNIKDFEQLLNEFVNYERPEIAEFKTALQKFKEHIEPLSAVLRKLLIELEQPENANTEFINRRNKFLNLCKNTINPDFAVENIREMIIQHILTEEIFTSIYDETQFHKENTVATELQAVIDTFFKAEIKRATRENTKTYLEVIKARAAQITDHHRKQEFLNLIYEEFYNAYNPKGADRLGIVYTPREIVQFIIESTEYLCYKNFEKLLSDKNVEILDPCTGTGTFIVELIDYLSQNLEYKFENEIHANEVSILPYYIANLNIEYSFQQKTGKYIPFRNICFVDTLDNINSLNYNSKQILLWDLSQENAQRVQNQNTKKISVIIGNPPYNANQLNENENNKNRDYPAIDERIKTTYIKESSAQKTKVYDMYTRFIRWATDRLDKNGIIGFVSNNSFINARTFDGFRKTIAKEFNEIYIIDLKGNARTSGENWHKEGGKIFGNKARVGIAIYFLIKNEKQKGCKIFYTATDDYASAETKKKYLTYNKIQDINFQHIQPDKDGNWINLPEENDWNNLMPLANKITKLTKKRDEENAIFKLFSLGLVTNRDGWVFDFDKMNLGKKIKYFLDVYNNEQIRWKNSDKSLKINDFVNREIKFTSELEEHLIRGTKLFFNDKRIIKAHYRPFTKKYLYFDRIITHRQYQNDNIFGIEKQHNNLCIYFSGTSTNKPFQTLASDIPAELGFLEATQSVPLYRYENGTRTDNITDFALQKFNNHYNTDKITKKDIFNYSYAVLHYPEYRKKYELNLKRDFPRIPFYTDFFKWTKWGEQLIDLHINYENAETYHLEIEHKKFKDENQIAKPRLISNQNLRTIEIDTQTKIINLPKELWEYKLGNISAIDRILEQYKEHKIQDKTINQKFNNYSFADNKTEVIELIKKICTVSLQTLKIMNLMNKT